MAEEGSVLALMYEISADPSKAIEATSSFQRQASQALRELEIQFGEWIVEVSGISGAYIAALGAMAGATIGVGLAMFELAHKAAETGAKIYELHEKTGLSSESLSGLSAVATLNGESFESLSMALGRATVQLQKQIDTGGGAHSTLAGLMGGAQGLAELGLKPMDERLQEVLKRIFELNDVGERNRALQELMGRGWQTNVETLKFLAEEGFGEAIKKAKELGVEFDDHGAAAAKHFEQELAAVKGEAAALALTIGKALIPVVGTFLEQAQHLDTSIPGLVRAYAGWRGETAKLAEEHKSLAKILEEEEKATEEWFKNNEARIAGEKFVGELYAKMLRDREEGAKRIEEANRKTLLAEISNIEEEEKYNAKVKKGQEELAVEREKLTAEEIKVRQQLTNQFYANTARDEEKETRDLERNTRERVRIILEGYKEQERLEKDAHRRGEEMVKETIAAVRQAHAEKMRLMKEEYSTTIGILGAIGSAFKHNHEIEVARTLARAALKAAEEHALALAAFAAGHVFAGVLHEAAAAAFLGMGAVSAFSGGSSASGGAATAAAGPASAGGVGPPLAPGAQPGGPAMQVLIVGHGEAAEYLTSVIDHGVKYSNLQLTASQVKQ